MALQPRYHFIMALTSAILYRFPSRGLIVIGVTGTKGKTTVVEILHRMLEEGGMPTASVSSLWFRIRDGEVRNMQGMTMPGRFFVQRFLAQARSSGCTHTVIEVTSEGIRQYRHRFIRFRGAVMTNVAPEHIESHGGFENYLRAKLDLFWRIRKDGYAIINRDDPHADRFFAATPAPTVYYGKDGIREVLHRGTSGGCQRQWRVADIAADDQGVRFLLNDEMIASPLPGIFNAYNLLASSASALQEGVSVSLIKKAASEFTAIPGRMEYVQKEPFSVVIDYAHTPDSLKNVYSFLRESNSKLKTQNSKLICVLGSAGGGRDTWKRPEMGKIAAAYCDEIILTNEDPYDEAPEKILEDIFSGASHIRNIRRILDRREAIRQAIRMAQTGDTVIITGKGAEPWMHVADGKKIPWDERTMVEKELKWLL